MKTVTIKASDMTVNVSSTAQELQIVQRPSMQSIPSFQPSIGVVIEKSTNSVMIETRPIADDKALKTQRLNRALQVGYFAPIKETNSKLK